VIVAHARKVRLIGESRKKDDRLDAQTLARLRESIPLPNNHNLSQKWASLPIRIVAAARRCHSS
jgi:hypothetical protein